MGAPSERISYPRETVKMVTSITIRPPAHGYLCAAARWLRLQFKIARDQRTVENLPDERLEDIGLDRGEIPQVVRYGRRARRICLDAENRASAQEPASNLGARA